VLSASVRGSPGRRRLALRVGLPVAVAVMLLICYWLTLAPTITDPDSGELATAVHTMGVAHPTGYPLYLIVGKLFDLLPLGEPARRIAFFSAVSAAAGGGLLCWMLIALTGSGAAGVLGGLVLGLNWWVWPQANQVEVYALHVLLVCLVLAMFVRWLEQRTPRRLSQLAFCCGLALTHHRTSLFFIMPVLVWALVATRPVTVLGLAKTVGWGLLPLLLYGWLPYRSAHHPPFDWGNTSASLHNFLVHTSARIYYVFAFSDIPAKAWAETRSWLVKLNEQFSIVGLALVLVGMVGMVRSSRYRALGISLTLSFAVVATWAAFYRVPDRDPFYLPALIVVSAWCGAGLGYVLAAVRGRRLDPRLARLVPAAAAVVALILPLNMLAANRKLADRSGDYALLDAAAVVLTNIPSDAVVLLWGDDVFSAGLYHYYALDHRPVPLVLGNPLLSHPWHKEQLAPEIRKAAALAVARDGPDVFRRPEKVVCAVRECVAPERPLYANTELSAAPPGYVLLRDHGWSGLVLPPGLPQAADAPGSRPLLQLRGGGSSLLGVSMPRQVKRGEPFAVTAAIRWRGGAAPDEELFIIFAHSDIAEGIPAGTLTRTRGHLMVRQAPLLFALAAPAGRPGHHYEQTLNALFPRNIARGTYHVFAQLAWDQGYTLPAPSGTIRVR